MKPTKSIHGARGGWHGAKIRAHQLANTPKRVMHAPVGKHPTSLELRSGLTVRDPGGGPLCYPDVLCEGGCGFIACSKSGPCALAQTVAAEGAIPTGSVLDAMKRAKALDNLPPPIAKREWKGGDRARCIDDTFSTALLESRRPTRDAQYTVADVSSIGTLHFDGLPGYWNEDRFDLVTEAAPAAKPWSPEQCGWRKSSYYGVSEHYEHKSARINAGAGTSIPAYAMDCQGVWRCGKVDGTLGSAPTLAQACCAAIGIELQELRLDGKSTWGAYAGGDCLVLVTAFSDIESCARAALERYHEHRGAGR